MARRLLMKARMPDTITTSSGLILNYTVSGQLDSAKPPVVLVHGYLSSHRTFDQLKTLLAPHRTVIALDLPGFGQSPVPGSAAGADETSAPTNALGDRAFFGAAVIEFLDALQLRDVILVGHSMGGGVCQEAAYLAPERIAQLICINSVGVEVPWAAKLAVIPWLGTALFAVFFGLMSLLGRVTARPIACARAVALATLKGTIRVLHRARTSLTKLRVPTTLLWGEQDALLTTTSAYRLADLIPNATLRLIPNAGHFPTTDAPEALCNALLESIAKPAG